MEPPCVDTGPCSVEIAVATWNGGSRGSWTGYALAFGTVDGVSAVLVGSPNDGPSEAAVLAASDLGWIGKWSDPNDGDSSQTSRFGTSLAVSADGVVAIGATSGSTAVNEDGLVRLFDRWPSAVEPPTARLLLVGDLGPSASFGEAVGFFDVAGNGHDLVVGTGNANPDFMNGILLYDETLAGQHGTDSAKAKITGAPLLGQVIAGWDSDADGVAEIVSVVDQGVAHFPAPWTNDMLEADADAVYTERDSIDQFGSTLEVLDDVDGDGLQELAIGANTYEATVDRGGGLWLVAGGPVASLPGEELPYAFLGTRVGDGFGSTAASGDYDGDGQSDLVVGAYGLVPGHLTGQVLLYLGPLAAGVRTSAEADLVVHGEALYDWFGAEAETVRADGDVQDDLVVSAQNWNGRGRVYLFLGSDLFP